MTNQGMIDRQSWVSWLDRIAKPVLESLHERKLKAVMPVQASAGDRNHYTYLEALGRLLTGMAPWLELQGLEGEEEALRAHYARWAREAIDAATNPDSPDAMNFSYGGQPIVDAAFLSHALVRAPKELIGKLEAPVRHHLANALRATRTRKPGFSNWLLFAAMTETALYLLGEDWDRMRVDYALRQHEQWYLGDGMYGDGPEYHADYYNSFVIQPMLVDIVRTLGHEEPEWEALTGKVMARAARYAAQQERMISPEGTFPPIGRSLAYRFGAFQMLAQASLQGMLPAEVQPAGVRCALTAVIRRTLEMPGTFDAEGWLRIGFCGDQPEVGERYISTGSLYLCTAVFLPLGLPGSDDFWQGEADWTTKKAWSGQPFPIDHALK
ncbi:DUF2264 domain-containing protein [Paenibacillus filicis]|uniref:DUF2264 domain-containing protein n=1 Tax=Paenibacillus gyeongsangnamensis TaxID=3388067 RepID=A0ABT4QGG8_9BACL|nr:DUF2264 domain-containing protein [Paenibacillus filicis]MCZ8515982.1 DUF2264 domain-containing protein [Paenibacillus filicis]